MSDQDSGEAPSSSSSGSTLHNSKPQPKKETQHFLYLLPFSRMQLVLSEASYKYRSSYWPPGPHLLQRAPDLNSAVINPVELSKFLAT